MVRLKLYENEEEKIFDRFKQDVELLEKILDTQLKRPISIFDLPKRTKEIKQNRPSEKGNNPEIAFEISDILEELNTVHSIFQL